jgi:hypothetical protein
MAVPLLATTRAWRARLRARPAAGPLGGHLAAAEQRLTAHWAAFVSAQAAAVDAYDGRSKIGLQGGEPFGVAGPLLRAAQALLCVRAGAAFPSG